VAPLLAHPSTGMYAPTAVDISLLVPAPSSPVLRFVAIHVPPYRVCVSFHDGQLLWGTFVAFDRVMNPVLHDCVELSHPLVSIHRQEGRHALGPFMFHSVEIVSMTIEALSSPPSMVVVSLLATSGSSAHPNGSVGGASPGSLLIPHVLATHSCYPHRLDC
jgi:small nuclear ribonucleoprotein (snRNP)-like protein